MGKSIVDQYQQFVVELFTDVGGQENIISLTHCISRMRFKLKDWDKINKDKIKNSEYAKGIVEAPGEFQVVIGSNIDKFYQCFIQINGYSEEGIKLSTQKENADFKLKNTSRNENGKWSFKIWCKNSLSFISKVFAPLIPILLAYGMVQTINGLFSIQWNGVGSSATEKVFFFKELYDIIKILGDGLTLFITIAVSYTAFKAMGGNGIYGLALGIVLTVPGLVAMGSIDPKAPGTVIEKMPGWNLFGKGVYPWKISYSGLIIPMILVAIFGGYLERWTTKISNGTLRMLFQPILIIFGAYLFAMFLMAPVGLLFTSYLSEGINWLSTNYIAKYIAIPLIGSLYGPMVILGLHRAITPLLYQGQALHGGTVLMGFVIINNVCQGIATLTFTYQYQKVKAVRDLSLPNGIAAVVGGVTEPVIYSTNFKYLYPLIATSIGTFVGTFVIVATNVFTTVGAFGIFGILMFHQNMPPEIGITTAQGGGLLWGTLALLLGMVTTFLATLILGEIKTFKNRTIKMIKKEYNLENVEMMSMKQIKFSHKLKTRK